MLDGLHWFPLSTLRDVDRDYSDDLTDTSKDWVQKVVSSFQEQKVDQFVENEVTKLDLENQHLTHTGSVGKNCQQMNR